jgi:hypothetical protein
MKFLEPSPFFSILDFGNVSLCDSEASSDMTLRSFHCPNLLNLFSGEFMPRQFLALQARRSATFFFTVVHVVFMRAEKQMVRVNAQPGIAMMTYAHAIRDGSPIELPRNTMRSSLASIYFNFSVSTAAHSAFPQPTTRISLWRESIRKFLDANHAMNSHLRAGNFKRNLLAIAGGLGASLAAYFAVRNGGSK